MIRDYLPETLLLYGMVALAIAGMTAIPAVATSQSQQNGVVNHTGTVDEVDISKGTENLNVTVGSSLPNESSVDKLPGTPVAEIVDRPRGTTFGELTDDEFQKLKTNTVLGTYSDKKLAAIMDSPIGVWSVSETAATAHVTTSLPNQSGSSVTVSAPDSPPSEQDVAELKGTPVADIVDAPRNTTFAELSDAQQQTLKEETALGTWSDDRFATMVTGNSMEIGRVSVLTNATSDQKIWYTAGS